MVVAERELKTLPMSQEDFEILEGLVHEYGPAGLVKCLSMMCHFQADLMRREQFDDPELAKQYDHDAMLLNSLKLKVK